MVTGPELPNVEVGDAVHVVFDCSADFLGKILSWRHVVHEDATRIADQAPGPTCNHERTDDPHSGVEPEPAVEAPAQKSPDSQDRGQSIRQHVRTTLAGGGFEILEAVDGLDALQQLKARNDIDVVICDVNMPRLDGLGLLDELKAAGVMERLQVLMLTTEGQPAMMQRAKAAGAKGWIVKPFKPPLLLATIQKIAGK